MDPFLVSVLSNIGLFSFLALSAWTLLLAGEISFGQQAYFALGAYGGGVATAVWGWPLGLGLGFAILVGALAGALVAWPTMRLGGLRYAIATLAFAELVRAGLLLFRHRREVEGHEVGPDGVNGFRDIRWVFENGVEPFGYMLLIYALLGGVLGFFWLMSRGRALSTLRMIGEDPLLAAMQGLPVRRWRVGAATLAGAIAGLGGALFAHMTTYVEPAQFNVMTGVHALAYGLIGGLGAALGPVLGVLIDIGLLESLRVFAGYRMIVFGGLVALVLILRPRGLLDERAVRRLAAWRRG